HCAQRVRSLSSGRRGHAARTARINARHFSQLPRRARQGAGDAVQGGAQGADAGEREGARGAFLGQVREGRRHAQEQSHDAVQLSRQLAAGEEERGGADVAAAADATNPHLCRATAVERKRSARVVCQATATSARHFRPSGSIVAQWFPRVARVVQAVETTATTTAPETTTATTTTSATFRGSVSAHLRRRAAATRRLVPRSLRC
ncbi:MAG: hypothetical protein MHM6MM_009530, partial [Cercozoa sp. M6MM]